MEYREKILSLDGYVIASGRTIALTPQPIELSECALVRFGRFVYAKNRYVNVAGRDGDYICIRDTATPLTPREWDVLLRGGNPWDKYCEMYHKH